MRFLRRQRKSEIFFPSKKYSPRNSPVYYFYEQLLNDQFQKQKNKCCCDTALYQPSQTTTPRQFLPKISPFQRSVRFRAPNSKAPAICGRRNACRSARSPVARMVSRANGCRFSQIRPAHILPAAPIPITSLPGRGTRARHGKIVAHRRSSPTSNNRGHAVKFIARMAKCIITASHSWVISHASYDRARSAAVIAQVVIFRSPFIGAFRAAGGDCNWI